MASFTTSVTKAIQPLIGAVVILLLTSPAIGQQYTDDQNQQQTYGRQNSAQQDYRNGADDRTSGRFDGNRMGRMGEQMGPMQQRMDPRDERMGRMGGMGRQDQSPYSGPQEYRDRADRSYGEPRGYMQENSQRQFQNKQRQMPTESTQPSEWQVERGMVRIGYDLNNDGRLDAFQYIPYYELQRMQQQYPSREQRGGPFAQRDQSSYEAQEDRGAQGYFEEQPQARQRRLDQRLDSVQGKIQETRTVRFAEMNEPHVIARISTQNNRVARVDLGPQKKVSELNLKQNDQVKVYGTPGNINDKPYLVAHYVVYNQQQHAINRPQDKNIRSYTGQILKTRSVDLGEQGSKVLVARVRLQNGNTTMANLGPEKELQNNLNVQQGKTIHMLARPAFIAGKKALVAETVRIDDQRYDVQWQQIAQQQQGQKQQRQQPAAGQTRQ